MAEYTLPIERYNFSPESLAERGLADASITRNAGWFVALRWIVSATLLLAGLFGSLFSKNLASIGLDFPSRMLWVLGVVLVVTNIPLFIETRTFGEKTRRRKVLRNIWMQISLDLAVVSVLVHAVGAVTTFIPFTYLFHIVLACIFFPPRESLLVTCIATVLYLTIIVAEVAGFVPIRGVFVEGRAIDLHSGAKIGLALLAPLIWFIVWYITSTLSKEVRLRDQQLSVANEQLKEADEEKNQQMLITTHDLKAPFAGIESNIQVLHYQYWDDLPTEIQTIIERINRRARMLRERINAILVLGNLKSRTVARLSIADIDLSELIDEVVLPLREKAESRDVSFSINVPSLVFTSDPEQLGILFSNIIANAILYSRETGTAHIDAELQKDEVHVRIRDDGIGIREDALPHIFDEYYRTREASQFNKQSTGLGLAIVKVIAQKLKLKIGVRSEIDHGTEFTIIIPPNVETRRGE
jgi:two-component system, OmpR family, phosphate regulon sensor histidine kinase PhoR